jgi:hypothetical protein
MSLIKNQQTVNINSAFRQSGTDSDFVINIPLKKNNRYTHVAVIDVSIPKSYYLISENDNVFTIQENGATFTVTIPVGNYSITSFLYVLNNLFQQTQGLSHYTATFPNSKTEAQTGKMTFQHTNIQHNTDFIFGDGHLPEVMGFDRGSTNSFTLNQTHSTLISSNVCNFQKESTIFLHSNLASNDGQNDILIELFASGNADLSNINLTSGDLEEHSKQFTGSQSNSFRFYLTDEYRQGLNLNGINMLITLCFYEKQNIDSLMTGFIKYLTMYLEEERQLKEKQIEGKI